MTEKAGADPQEHIGPAPTAHDKTQEGVEAVVAEAHKHIDTTHQDEAMKVLATYDGDLHWTPAEEKVLVRKIDKRLMPILILTYGLQYYDKAMISQAVGRQRRRKRYCSRVRETDAARRSSGCVRIWICLLATATLSHLLFSTWVSSAAPRRRF